MTLTYDAIRNAKQLLVRLDDAPPEHPQDIRETKLVRQALFDFIQSADETRLELERLQKCVRDAARDLLDGVARPHQVGA